MKKKKSARKGVKMKGLKGLKGRKGRKGWVAKDTIIVQWDGVLYVLFLVVTLLLPFG